MINLVFTAIRTILWISERLMPSVGANVVLTLFSRPGIRPSNRKPSERLKRAAEILDGSERLDMQVRAFNQERRVRVYHWKAANPSAPKVLVVHGFDSGMRFLADFVPSLLEAGFEVMGLDLPGHGESEGKTVNYIWATESIQQVQRLYGTAYGIVGHSFGGAMSVLSSTGNPPTVEAIPVEKLVLIAAPNRLPNTLSRFRAQVGFGPRVDEAFRRKLARLGGRERADYGMDSNLAGSGIPTLVIHDRGDKEVPFTDAEEMSALAEVSVKPVEGWGHNRILGAPEVIESSVEFLANTLPAEKREKVGVMVQK